MNKSIFVIYPSGKLGDLIWHLPFFKHISELKNESIYLITRKNTSAQELLINEEYIKTVFYIDFKKYFHNYLSDIFKIYLLLKRNKAEEVWILDKNSRPAIAASLAKIRKINGYGIGNQSLWVNNKNKLQKRDLKTHYIERGIKFFELQNYPIKYEFIKMNLNKGSTNLFNFLYKKNLKIIIYGVDSSEMYRSWPINYFAELINKINTKYKLFHILIASPTNSNIADKIISEVDTKDITNYSHLKLGEIVNLLNISDLFIGNDSGILNLSAAVGLKSIGIYGATKSNKYSNKIIPALAKTGEIFSKYSDRPIDRKGRTIKDPSFAKRVKPDDVFKIFKDEIEKE